MSNLQPYFKYKVATNILNDLENWLDYNGNIEDVLDYAEKQRAYESNVGYRVERIENNEREKAFFEQWLKENEPVTGVNHGHGILQDLFIESTGFLGQTKVIELINERDRYIVATIIQWLGTNVGMSFLHAALERFGARIVFEDTKTKVA